MLFLSFFWAFLHGLPRPESGATAAFLLIGFYGGLGYLAVYAGAIAMLFLGAAIAAWYWHLVDVVWLVIIFFLVMPVGSAIFASVLSIFWAF